MAQETDFSRQLVQAMTAYTDDVKTGISVGLKDVGETALKKVKAGSPVRTGKYKRGWKLTIEDGSGVMRVTVRQGKHGAPLTHLLENGHRTRTMKGWVKAYPHILAVEEWAASEAVKVVEKAVKG